MKLKAVSGLMLALLLIPSLTSMFSVQSAEANPTVISGWSAFPVTLDGEITTGKEWSDTTPVDMTFLEGGAGPGAVSALVYMKNDDTWLYMLYRVEWPAGDIDPFDEAGVAYVWDWIGEPPPVWNHSDLGRVRFDNVASDAYGWEGTHPWDAWYEDTDASPPGENNVEGVATHDGTYYWFEFRKELDSGDGYDWSFTPGQVVETVSQVQSLVVGVWDASPGVPYFDYITLRLGYGTVYIRADGSVDPSTAPIRLDRDVYTFTGNIIASIVVEKDNIIVDGADYILRGTGSAHYLSRGIDLSGRSNVTIKNVEIDGFYYGICLSQSLDNTVSGNNITGGEYGIMLDRSSNNTVSGNNIANGENGICLASSSNNNIYGNFITATYKAGIQIYKSLFNRISGNNIRNNHDGVKLHYYSRNNSLSHNDITNNDVGIYVGELPYHFSPGNSMHNIIIENRITNNINGIYLSEYSGHNRISGNNITNNSWGIYFFAGIAYYGSSNNIIYYNNFVDNTFQVSSYALLMNVWDAGYPSGGNYWSDFKERYPDVEDVHSGPNQDQPGSDGIWDHPYVIDENNQDNYPKYARPPRRFSPSIDGFGFHNYGLQPGCPAYTLKQIYDKSKVLLLAHIGRINPWETLAVALYAFYTYCTHSIGHCYGISHASVHYYYNPDDLPSGYSCANDVKTRDEAPAVNLKVETYQHNVVFDADSLLKAIGYDLGLFIGRDALKSEIESIISMLDRFKPVIVRMGGPRGRGWHTAVAYDYGVDDTEIWVKFYDSMGYIPGHDGTMKFRIDAEGKYYVFDDGDRENNWVKVISTYGPISWTWDTIKDNIGKLIDWIKDKLSDLWDAITQLAAEAPELWNQFVAWIMDNAKDVWDKIVLLSLSCPADLHIYDASGNHVGLTPDGGMETGFPALFFVAGDTQQAVLVNPEAGDYHIEVIGTGKGSFTLKLLSIVDGTTISEKTISGEIEEGETRTYQISYEASSELTIVRAREAFPLCIVGVAVVAVLAIAIATVAIAVFWRRRKQPP